MGRRGKAARGGRARPPSGLREPGEGPELERALGPGVMAKLAAANRLASIGVLATGIAHEINNPLASIAANLSFLRDHAARLTGEGEALADMRAALDDAIDGSQQVREIVKRVWAFAEAPVGDALAPVDVTAEIEAALAITRHEVERRATLVVEVPGGLPSVAARRHELSQVFVNLLLNAVQAMAGDDPSRNQVRVAARAEPGRVIIAVHDSGVGIAPEIEGRIFEPFFTTRAGGQASGLGLAVSRGIVAAAGGAIEVESRPGSGAVFRVVLPAAAP